MELYNILLEEMFIEYFKWQSRLVNMVTDRLFQSSDNQDLFFRENIRCLFFISDDLDDLDDLDKSCLVLLRETLQV